mgnify:CR=1 FL=1
MNQHKKRSDIEKTNEWWHAHLVHKLESARAAHEETKLHVEELQRDLVHLQLALDSARRDLEWCAKEDS